MVREADTRKLLDKNVFETQSRRKPTMLKVSFSSIMDRQN